MIQTGHPLRLQPDAGPILVVVGAVLERLQGDKAGRSFHGLQGLDIALRPYYARVLVLDLRSSLG